MSDWLALHGLTPDICERLLESVCMQSPPSDPPVPDIAVDEPPEWHWKACAEAFGSRAPKVDNVISQVLSKTRVDFAPDLSKYPRAFTLHDSGNGFPFVSCPWRSQPEDILILAHEFAHAVQIVASAGREMPPVLRETCAYVGERWMASYFAGQGHPAADVLAACSQRRTATVLARTTPDFLAKVRIANSRYDYDWNYPLAVLLAERIALRSDGDQTWRIFEGDLSVPAIVQVLDL